MGLRPGPGQGGCRAGPGPARPGPGSPTGLGSGPYASGSLFTAPGGNSTKSIFSSNTDSSTGKKFDDSIFDTSGKTTASVSSVFGQPSPFGQPGSAAVTPSPAAPATAPAPAPAWGQSSPNGSGGSLFASAGKSSTGFGATGSGLGGATNTFQGPSLFGNGAGVGSDSVAGASSVTNFGAGFGGAGGGLFSKSTKELSPPAIAGGLFSSSAAGGTGEKPQTSLFGKSTTTQAPQFSGTSFKTFR